MRNTVRNYHLPGAEENPGQAKLVIVLVEAQCFKQSLQEETIQSDSGTHTLLNDFQRSTRMALCLQASTQLRFSVCFLFFCALQTQTFGFLCCFVLHFCESDLWVKISHNDLKTIIKSVMFCNLCHFPASVFIKFIAVKYLHHSGANCPAVSAN